MKLCEDCPTNFAPGRVHNALFDHVHRAEERDNSEDERGNSE
jgi:hypothetical protein